MSLLRIFGLILALVAFLVIFLRLRRHSESRFDVAVLSIFGTGLLLVSLFPSLINLPTEILSLDKSERGRLLTLLIISSVALWFLLIYERSKTQFLSQGFDRLSRTLTVEKFFEKPQSIQSDSILIIIPAYNEKDNLRSILPALPQRIHGRPVIPLIIDDGSQDNTSELCEEFEILYARNLINRGQGAALRAGFDIARKLDAQIIVTMDGDGQHRTEDVAGLVEPIVSIGADLVIGSRLLGEMERYSALRYWGVVFFSRMISLLIGQRITDPASGFRAFTLQILESCVLTQDQYQSPELIIEAAKKGVIVQERPIFIKKRLSGRSKKGKDLRYALCFLRTIVRTWIR